jgi:hypothetical protein
LTGASGPGGPEFKEFAEKATADHGVQFLSSVADLPAVAEGKKRLALVSGRTADNPKLLGDCIEVGFVVVAIFSD